MPTRDVIYVQAFLSRNFF